MVQQLNTLSPFLVGGGRKRPSQPPTVPLPEPPIEPPITVRQWVKEGRPDSFSEWKQRRLEDVQAVPEELPTVEPLPIAPPPIAEPFEPITLPETPDELFSLMETVLPEMAVSFGLTREEVIPTALENLEQLARERPEDLIMRLREGGRTPEGEALLTVLGASPEDIDAIFGEEEEPFIEPPPPPMERLVVEIDGVRQLTIRTEDNSLYDVDGNWVGYYDFLTQDVFNPYKAEGLAGKALASFTAGIGDVLSTGGGVARRFGYDEVGEKLSTVASQLQRYGVPSSSFEVFDLLNPEFYATKIARTIPFVLSLAPLAVGGFYGGTTLAIAVGLGRIFTLIVGGLTGAALSRPAESAMEAGSSYDDAIARGKSHEEASAEFDEVFRNNMTLAGADAFEIAIALAPTPKWVPTSLVKSGLVRTARIGGKMVIVGLSEGGEEIYQDLIQRRARGEEFKLDAVSKEVFIIGFVMGGGMALGGDVVSGIVDSSKTKMPTSMRKEFDNLTKGFKDDGFNQSESELKALDIIAQTLEGQRIVQEAVDEAKVEVPEAVVTPEVPIVEEVKPIGVEQVSTIDEGGVAPSEDIVVIKEGGVPIDPDEQISTAIVENTPFVRDIGAKERVRPARKVFEKMGLYKLFRGIQEAEVLIGEEKVARAKARNEIIKSVSKNQDRWSLIFREANEAGSQVGLTFEEKRAVNFIRKWADDWAEKKNLPLSKRIKNYIPHLFEQEMKTQLQETGKIPPEIAAMLDEKARSKITDPFLKKRLGALGFLEDPFKAMEAYDSVSLRALYYTPFLQNIAGIANDPNTPPVFRRYLSDYSRRMTGEMAKIDRELNNTIQEFAEKLRGLPGGDAFADALSKGNVSGWVSYNMTGVLYTLWLGFKATSAIRNLSQHSLIIAETGLRHFSNGIKLRFTTEGKSALSESLVLRSRKTAFVPGIDDSFAARWTDKFRETALFIFRQADKQNVSDAFLAGYSEAKQLLPDADRQVWIDRGDEVAADTQYLYTRMNSMSISQSAPGRVFSVLTTWSENWLELMNKWVSRRPSQVYTQYEQATGVKVTKPPWSQTFKSFAMYMLIVALGKLIKDETRFKAWEYTGVTSLRYLAGVAGGEFPGLTISGAVADFITGFVTDDERMFKSGWNQVKRAFTPGVINQLNNVAQGDKDWLTLLFYLEGLDYEVRKLKEEWKPDFKPYEDLSDPLIRAKQFPTLTQAKAQNKWREENPLIEAKMFVVNQFTTLSSEKAREEVLRLIEKHNIDTELIRGYDKVFGIDTEPELNKFQKRIGNLEKLVIGEEAEYFDMGSFAEEVHKMVDTQGALKVLADGQPLAVELLIAENLWKPYFDYEEEGARKLYRQLNPDVEAQLYLWGKIQAFENPDSAKELLRLMDKYNIPPQAINAFQQDPSKYDELFTQKFELEQKNFELTTQYENFANPEAPNFIEDKDERKLAREKFKEDNPTWVADQRRIEAIDNDASPETIEKWADRGKTIDEFNATGSEAQAWLLDNPEVHKWALDSKLLEDDGSDWNEPVIRLNVKMRDLDEQYDALSAEGDVRNDFLISHPEYNDDRRRRTMFRLDASDELVKDFVDYGHVIDKFSAGSSQAKIFRLDHPELDTFGVGEETLGWVALEKEDEPVWRIDVEFEKEDNEYQAILDRIEDNIKQTQATDAYLLEHPEYHKKRFERDALKINFPRVEEYVTWYTDPSLRRSDDLDASLPFYEDDWYLIEHPEFNKAMRDADLFTTRRDFRLVPMENGEPDRVVGRKYIEYLSIKNNQAARDQYRLNNPDLDNWGVSVGIWVRTMSEQRRREEQTATEKFKETIAEGEREREAGLEAIEEKLEELE